MADIVVSGNSSGSVTLRAPDVSGTTILTLPTTSGTLVTTAGGSTVPFALGSAAAPSITFTGDTNTGMFSPAADTIAFTEGGVESMRIDSSGNVGIGTGSPAQRLDATVSSATEGSGLAVTNSLVDGYGSGISFYSTASDNTKILAGRVGMRGTGSWANTANASSAMAFSTASAGTLSERMRITSAGNVGIGTSSPGALLHVATNTTALKILVNGDDGVLGNSDGLVVTYGGAGVANYRVQLSMNGYSGLVNLRNAADTQTVRIAATGDSYFTGGNLVIGATSTGTGKLRVDGTTGGVNLFVNYPDSGDGVRVDANTGGSAATSVYVMPVRTAGTLRGGIQWNGSNLLYNNTSDYRLKENISPMTGALEKVDKLKPVTYNWKESGIASQGFIAHELQAIVPDAVTGEKDAVDKDGKPVYQGVDSSFLVATLTAAIQELNAKVTALEKQLGAK